MIDRLPRGSGIDCDWEQDNLKNGKVVFSNSFHCMNTDGYYDGYADFSITVDLNNVEDFRLVFHGDYSQRKNRQYILREYLEELIYWCLTKEENNETDN